MTLATDLAAFVALVGNALLLPALALIILFSVVLAVRDQFARH